MGFTREIGEGREYSRKGERHEGRPETGQEKMCVGVSGSCKGKERLPVKWGVGIRGWVEASEVGTAGIGKGTLTESVKAEEQGAEMGLEHTPTLGK